MKRLFAAVKPWTSRALALRLISLVLPLAILGAVSIVPGCAHTGSAVSDNAVNYATSEQLYITTLRTLTSLASTGKLTRDQVERVERVRASANRVLDQWRASVLAGQAGSFQASFDTLITELIQLQLEAQGDGS